MRAVYVRAMDVLYLLCAVLGGASIVVMSLLIGFSVYMRYVVERALYWPEPIATLLAIQVTFYGAAVCYRANAHIALQVLADRLPYGMKLWHGWLIHLLMAGICVFMILYGISLAQTTWNQVYPEFQYVRVGLVYTAIPVSGAITLLFVIEKALFARRGETGGRDEVARELDS